MGNTSSKLSKGDNERSREAHLLKAVFLGRTYRKRRPCHPRLRSTAHPGAGPVVYGRELLARTAEKRVTSYLSNLRLPRVIPRTPVGHPVWKPRVPLSLSVDRLHTSPLPAHDDHNGDHRQQLSADYADKRPRRRALRHPLQGDSR